AGRRPDGAGIWGVVEPSRDVGHAHRGAPGSRRLYGSFTPINIGSRIWHSVLVPSFRTARITRRRRKRNATSTAAGLPVSVDDSRGEDRKSTRLNSSHGSISYA